MFWWERVSPPHHVFFHNGSGSPRLLPSAVIHAQSCPRRPPPAPAEVILWSTTFPFVSVWIIDEAGEAQPKRLQAEWTVQGVDGITQPLRMEALWTEYLLVYVIFLIDSSFNLWKVRNVKKKYHWYFLETQIWPLCIDCFILQAVGNPNIFLTMTHTSWVSPSLTSIHLESNSHRTKKLFISALQNEP